MNGAGSTMEDANPVIIPGGWNWGKGDEAKPSAVFDVANSSR